MNDDNEPEPSSWPPPVVPDTTDVIFGNRKENVAPKSLGGFLAGFVCGILVALIFGMITFVIFVRVGGAQMLHGTTSIERFITFYVEKAIQIFSLCVPVFLYFGLRPHYFSFAMGVFVGGSSINLFLLGWYFFGL